MGFSPGFDVNHPCSVAATGNVGQLPIFCNILSCIRQHYLSFSPSTSPMQYEINHKGALLCLIEYVHRQWIGLEKVLVNAELQMMSSECNSESPVKNKAEKNKSHQECLIFHFSPPRQVCTDCTRIQIQLLRLFVSQWGIDKMLSSTILYCIVGAAAFIGNKGGKVGGSECLIRI